MSEYKATIGIETHVQLKTKTKLFSGSDNDDRDQLPNSVVNHIDFGLPGSLPVLNKKAVELACIAAYALNTHPQRFSKFDRKHYFYPDLPMGYQISQFDEPIILGGYVEILLNGNLKKIGITRAHLEADAGKSIHPKDRDYSLVDLNRSGTPLLEIVSEPQMHTAEEAKAYTKELYLLMKFAGVSNANLYYGNMRFDVNVSISKNEELGTRAEIKNINSFRSVERSILYEIKRQEEVLKSGANIIQETRGWDDEKAVTYSMRTKENADDYRYMPEPDIPPVILSIEYISKIEEKMPILPNEIRHKLLDNGLDLGIADVLIESDADYSLDYSSTLLNLQREKIKPIANLIVNVEVPLRSKHESISLSSEFRLKLYLSVIDLLESKKLSSTNAKVLIEKILLNNKIVDDIEKFADSNKLLQSTNLDEVNSFIEQVVAENPKAIEDIKDGQDKAIGFLVGQMMKLSKGKINPAIAKEALSKYIK